MTINYRLIDKGSESSKIKELIHDLRSKQYVFSIVPEKLIHMNNGINIITLKLHVMVVKWS